MSVYACFRQFSSRQFSPVTYPAIQFSPSMSTDRDWVVLFVSLPQRTLLPHSTLNASRLLLPHTALLPQSELLPQSTFCPLTKALLPHSTLLPPRVELLWTKYTQEQLGS